MHNKSIKLTDISETIRKIDRFRGMADSLIEQKTRIIMDLDKAHQYIDRKDEVTKALEMLQERAQAKTKTIYEDLLTQFRGLRISYSPLLGEREEYLLLIFGRLNQRPFSGNRKPC